MSRSHATLRYTSMRVTIFIACYLVGLVLAHVGVIPVAGSSGLIFLVLLAGLVSAPISYVVLSRHRDAMSSQIVGKVSGMRSRTIERIAAQNAEEDEVDDANRADGRDEVPSGDRPAASA